MIVLKKEDIQIYNTPDILKNESLMFEKMKITNDVITGFSSGFKLVVISISNGIQLKPLNDTIRPTNYSDRGNVVKINGPTTTSKLSSTNSLTLNTQEVSLMLRKDTKTFTFNIDFTNDSIRSTLEESEKQMVFNEKILRETKVVENLSVILILFSILVLLVLPFLLAVEWLAIVPALILLFSFIVLISIRKLLRRE